MNVENLYVQITGFAACAAIIIFSGSKLSHYGNRIAELTGIGKAWVGLILLASVTSLPELITGISAVAIVKAPDLAAGDIFGACVYNLLILSVLDARIKKPLFSVVKSSHIVAAIFGIILMATAGMSIYLAAEIPTILWISTSTIVIAGVYLIAIRGMFRYEHADGQHSKTAIGLRSASHTAELRTVIGGYALHGLIVVGAAIFLPFFGEKIAAQTGLGNTFFGTLFVAAATTLPELVVSMSALKINALDMAIGNLLGSNVFNMFILGIVDVFYIDGSLFRDISPSHLISVLTTITMTAIVGLGLLFKPGKKQLWLLSLDTFIIAVLYVWLVIHLFIKS